MTIVGHGGGIDRFIFFLNIGIMLPWGLSKTLQVGVFSSLFGNGGIIGI